MAFMSRPKREQHGPSELRFCLTVEILEIELDCRARKMENISDEAVHFLNANDDIALHPSKDVNHAAGNADELRLRVLQVQVMEIHYTSPPLPEQKLGRKEQTASHYYTHAPSLSLPQE